MLHKFNEEVQWKINTLWDENQMEKLKVTTKLSNEHRDKQTKASGGGTSDQSQNGTL
jgi:hypothetical protein